MHESNMLASSLLNEYLSYGPFHQGQTMELPGGTGLYSFPRLFEETIDAETIENYPYYRDLFHLGFFDEIDEKIYENNPYYRLLQGVHLSYRKVHLGKRVYAPMEGFLYQEISLDEKEDFREVSPFGYFPNGFEAPALEKDGRIWMSLIPHEINTMAKPIEEASGKVLTFGLGLGYYAFMCSEKEDVSSVTIVENDPAVIAIFRKALLPLFPHKEKIEIIEKDAFAFLKEADLSPYSYRFVDLYHDEEDGLPIYLRFLKEEKARKISFSYWIEGSILVYLRRYVCSLIEEEREGWKDEDYQPGDFVENLFRDLHFALKKRILKSEEDIDRLMRKEGIREIAETIA